MNTLSTVIARCKTFGRYDPIWNAYYGSGIKASCFAYVPNPNHGKGTPDTSVLRVMERKKGGRSVPISSALSRLPLGKSNWKSRINCFLCQAGTDIKGQKWVLPGKIGRIPPIGNT